MISMHETAGPAATLVAEMASMDIVDSHEHLPREEELLAEPADVFTRLLGQYVPTAVASAGLPDARTRLKDTRVPLEERWRLFRPFLDAVSDTGPFRSAVRAARDLFGVEEISDGTYAALSDRLREADTPGIYHRVLADRCRIMLVINQGSWQDRYARSVYRPFMYLPETDPRDLAGLLSDVEAATGGEIGTAAEWARRWCGDVAAHGCIGLKFAASLPTDPIGPGDAERLFRKLRARAIEDGEAKSLGVWLAHEAIRTAPEHHFVVAIHCGINWEVNMDIASQSPMNVVPLLMRYRATSFDLYHGGIPWVREMGVIGNQYPNAHLNLCWSHQGSPAMTECMLGEWIDLVPANKIIGFGGDVSSGPYKVYGALCLARENIARALAARITRGEMSESRAVALCRAWLLENPKRIYGV